MDYTLALKLKEAGFPQDGYGEYIESPDIRGKQVAFLNPEKTCYVPDLSELIEACGENGNKFDCLHQQSVFRDDDERWMARPIGLLCEDVFGNTPEEAVANLWLELNKK